MSQHQRMIQLIKSMSGQSNILTIPRLYVDLTGGDIEAALFLSQCVYWSDKTKNKYGFYKSLKEWKLELGLSRFKIYACAKKCSGWISISKHRANNAPTLHYKVNLQKLAEDISSLCVSVTDSDLLETDKSLCDSVSDSDLSVSSKSDLSVSSKCDLLVSSKSITETTKKIHNNSGGEKHAATQNGSIAGDTQKSTTREIQAAYAEACGYPVDWVAGNAKAAKWLSKNGFSASDVAQCYAALKSQEFWKDKTLGLSSLKNQIGEWKKRHDTTKQKITNAGNGFYA